MNNMILDEEYKPTISMIIPVYNVEKTIKRCIQSAINQTFKDYELILVDDGSTDNSSSICERYKKCKKVKVIHKTNGGLGSARNEGIRIAEGKYICFVDGDDYIMPNYLEAMYNAITKENADMVISGYVLRRNKYSFNYSPRKIIGSYEGSDYYCILLEYAKGNSIFYYAWNKLMKRSIIIENELRFSDRHCAEDMLFNALYYKYSGRLVIIPECLYIYTVDNINSLSNRRRSGFWSDMKEVLAAYQVIYEKVCINQFLQMRINELVLILLRNTFSNYISNEKFNIIKSKLYIEKCCKDLAVIERISMTKPTYMSQKLLKTLIINRKYGLIAIIIWLKSILKKRFFYMFNLLRKNN